MGRFTRGMMMGLIVGAAAEMMMMPYQNRKTKKNMKRAGRRIRNMAEATLDGMHDWRD
ncbi:YtxH domain-containing protein [Clostridium saccharobutylicum]|uniref:YtxH-like protein n=1 Tax=Clostridium saccharobutylicum TaxID=169679 RepID=A0A1S8NIS3_CLOSA|nr:YtxH domain-containing protein [Clostridium saccharobutylicum]OOM16337.1 hypothetical protein CLOSAC_06080 [Clostridium saccharobutylicum]